MSKVPCESLTGNLRPYSFYQSLLNRERQSDLRLGNDLKKGDSLSWLQRGTKKKILSSHEKSNQRLSDLLYIEKKLIVFIYFPKV